MYYQENKLADCSQNPRENRNYDQVYISSNVLPLGYFFLEALEQLKVQFYS